MICERPLSEYSGVLSGLSDTMDGARDKEMNPVTIHYQLA